MGVGFVVQFFLALQVVEETLSKVESTHHPNHDAKRCKTTGGNDNDSEKSPTPKRHQERLGKEGEDEDAKEDERQEQERQHHRVGFFPNREPSQSEPRNDQKENCRRNRSVELDVLGKEFQGRGAQLIEPESGGREDEERCKLNSDAER